MVASGPGPTDPKPLFGSDRAASPASTASTTSAADLDARVGRAALSVVEGLSPPVSAGSLRDRSVEETTPVQIIEGRGNFYIGVPATHKVCGLGARAIAESIPEKTSVRLVSEPHMTIVPPSSKISPSTRIGRKFEGSFSITFDKLCISPAGGLTLRGTTSETRRDFSRLSRALAEEYDCVENNRDPHIVLGKITNPAELREMLEKLAQSLGFFVKRKMTVSTFMLNFMKIQTLKSFK